MLAHSGHRRTLCALAGELRSMDHSARTRRRMAYPILTLCVAGVIWLVSTGRISVEPQVEPAVYESFVREVVESARRGQGPLADGDDLLARTWRRMAPSALQSPDGGAFQVRSEVESDRAPDLVLPRGGGDCCCAATPSQQQTHIHIHWRLERNREQRLTPCHPPHPYPILSSYELLTLG